MAGRVRRSRLVAPGMQLSNTRDLTPPGPQSEFTLLVDYSADSDGAMEAKTHTHGEERCHSTEA